MKKIVLLALLASLSSVYAASGEKILIGAEYGVAKGKKDKYYSHSIDNIGLRAGIENKKTRIYGSYNYINDDKAASDPETHILVLNLEAKTEKYYNFFRAFAGFHVGAIYTDVATEDETDALGGVQAGGLMELTDAITLEAGVKYSWTTSDRNSINVIALGSAYGAVNFKF